MRSSGSEKTMCPFTYDPWDYPGVWSSNVAYIRQAQCSKDQIRPCRTDGRGLYR